jgi:hypothetical protein
MSTVSTRPTVTSARIAVGIGVVCVIALFWPVREFVTMALLAALGVGCLSLAVRLLGDENPGPADRFAASLLAAPASLLLLGGLTGIVVVLLGRQFPVPSGAGIPTATLRLIAHVGVVLGCMIAMLGLATTVRDVLTPSPLARFSRSALICGTVPLGVGAVLAAASVLLRSGPRTGGDTLLSEMVTATLSPDGVHLHLGSFLFTVALAAGAVWLLSVVLPYEDALSDAGFGPSERAWLDRLVWASTLLGVAAGAAFPAALYAEFALSSAQLRRAIGAGTFELLQSVTTVSLFRYLLVGVAAFALGVAASVTVARAVYGRSATTAGWLIPAGAGALLTVVAAATAVSLYEWVVDRTAAQLPPAVAARFVDTTQSVRLTYGESAIVIVSLGLLTVLAAGLAYGLRGAISVGYLSSAGGGYSLASSGLLLGTVSVGALGSSAWLVFGGVLAAVLVWDIGHYGVDLGRMIGPGPTRSAELVHAGASLLVGVTAVLTALLLRAVFQTRTFDPSPARLLALVAVVVGLTALVVATRR